MVRKRSGGYDGNMLSYLHGFHAGNAADVLKHSVLIFCLDYLKKKESPLLCVDTHAGAGFYDLSESAAAPNREWEKGVGRLGVGAGQEVGYFPSSPRIFSRFTVRKHRVKDDIRTSSSNFSDIVPAENTVPAPPSMITSYLEAVGGEKNGLPGRRYPGSPVIMARLLRKGDRLVCFELHPGESETLRRSLKSARAEKGRDFSAPLIEARQEDGPAGLKALLPPPSRRGLILVDPSWEEQSEYESVPQALLEGLRRFPEGTFIVWYPLLARPKEKTPVPLGETLFTLSEVKGPRRGCCRAELYTELGPQMAAPDGSLRASPRGMYGSGLVVYNPPWTLGPALEEALPYLAETLGGAAGGWRLDRRE